MNVLRQSPADPGDGICRFRVREAYQTNHWRRATNIQKLCLKSLLNARLSSSPEGRPIFGHRGASLRRGDAGSYFSRLRTSKDFEANNINHMTNVKNSTKQECCHAANLLGMRWLHFLIEDKEAHTFVRQMARISAKKESPTDAGLSARFVARDRRKCRLSSEGPPRRLRASTP